MSEHKIELNGAELAGLKGILKVYREKANLSGGVAEKILNTIEKKVEEEEGDVE